MSKYTAVDERLNTATTQTCNAKNTSHRKQLSSKPLLDGKIIIKPYFIFQQSFFHFLTQKYRHILQKNLFAIMTDTEEVLKL